jgi:hypothetical protein
MYIMGENPAMSDPDATTRAQALAALQMLVVQDIFLTETARWPTWCCRPRPGREDRQLHQHRPLRAARPQGPGPARAGAAGPVDHEQMARSWGWTGRHYGDGHDADERRGRGVRRDAPR